MVEEFNGQCWYIVRKENLDIDMHISENNLSQSDFKNIIYNNDTKEIFINQWKNILKNNIL